MTERNMYPRPTSSWRWDVPDPVSHGYNYSALSKASSVWKEAVKILSTPVRVASNVSCAPGRGRNATSHRSATFMYSSTRDLLHAHIRPYTLSLRDVGESAIVKHQQSHLVSAYQDAQTKHA